MIALGGAVLLLCAVTMLVEQIGRSEASVKECLGENHSPVCICRSPRQNCTSNALFLSTVVLAHCQNDSSARHCRQGHFRRPSFRLMQLLPQLADHPRCLQDRDCLHTLPASLRCTHCQLSPMQNDTLRSSALPGNACLYLCSSDASCGFLCLNENMTIALTCRACQTANYNLTCWCMEPRLMPPCFPLPNETRIEPWMEKDGFPAAGFFVMVVMLAVIFCLVVKLIYCQLDRREGALRDSPTFIHHSVSSYSQSTQCGSLRDTPYRK